MYFKKQIWLKVLKVTEERVRFYRFTGKEPAALRKE